MEIWKDIKGYEGLYQISNYGNVKSLERVIEDNKGSYIKKEKILTPTINNRGYYHIGLRNNSKTKYYYVHRLVAEAFIPNPNNYPIINHKDEDKTNNKVDNLEWCTPKYNANYGTAIQRRITTTDYSTIWKQIWIKKRNIYIANMYRSIL